jgi:hypothetical protein
VLEWKAICPINLIAWQYKLWTIQNHFVDKLVLIHDTVIMSMNNILSCKYISVVPLSTFIGVRLLHNFKYLFSVWMLCLTPNFVFAQGVDREKLPVEAEEFQLFGSLENETQDDASIKDARATRRQASANREPEFTLIGTSRIGDRYSAILRNQDGSEVVVTTEMGRNTRIEGYGEYSVVDVGAGRVSVQFPSGSDCIEFRDQGVSCNGAANIASLELTRADPIPRPMITAGNGDTEVEDEGEVVVSEEGAEEPENPFAALRARALQRNGDAPVAPASAPRRSFTPRRIDPADVPPGMRVVSTPFGDRLVRE